jgi:hypothetical protein
MLATQAAEFAWTGSLVASACQTLSAGNVPQDPGGGRLPLGLTDGGPTAAVPGSAAPDDPPAAASRPTP